jgi:urease accessory protein
LSTEAAGRGRVGVERIGGKSVVTRVEASSPLRLLTPRGPAESAWVFTSTLGGGLLSEDRIEIDLAVDAGAACLLSTQSQTKVYRAQTCGVATQQMHVRAASDAMIVSMPDAVTCFAGSAFYQRQRFELVRSSSLVMLDWLTSGRRARGERWAFRRYDSGIEVCVDGKLVFRDSLYLDEEDGSIDARHRMGACDCFATLLLMGPRLAEGAAALLAWSSSQPVSRRDCVIFSASPIADGAVARVVGPSTESVGGWIRERLGFVPRILGGDPWARKW